MYVPLYISKYNGGERRYTLIALLYKSMYTA